MNIIMRLKFAIFYDTAKKVVVVKRVLQISDEISVQLIATLGF